ncbi:MAG: Plug domain-containing protein [Betaproteobacteria bacterium]|nr:Plug domain-containing protein [Betaproteobacteria bacterium]
MRRTTPLAVLLLGIASSNAQEPARDDALNVTATRIERPSLETPASVDSVQAEDIRLARPQVDLSESLGRVPGIIVANRQNYAQDLQISSRGFGTRATFGIRGMRLIADGIPASMPDGQGQATNFDLGAAERIEVLRGPFAVMYGNAAGGVVDLDRSYGGSSLRWTRPLTLADRPFTLTSGSRLQDCARIRSRLIPRITMSCSRAMATTAKAWPTAR